MTGERLFPAATLFFVILKESIVDSQPASPAAVQIATNRGGLQHDNADISNPDAPYCRHSGK
ncbi:hypothetical protein JXO59_10445 [candidate division KSB1 bacterium]|nr:hypothetical protein [candidate division KSB1 bacterium]